MDAFFEDDRRRTVVEGPSDPLDLSDPSDPSDPPNPSAASLTVLIPDGDDHITTATTGLPSPSDSGGECAGSSSSRELSPSVADRMLHNDAAARVAKAGRVLRRPPPRGSGGADAAVLTESAESNGTSVDDFYDILETRLGAGHFSTVLLGRRKSGKQFVAIKRVLKARMSSERLAMEVRILRAVSLLHHPNLVQLQHCFESALAVHLVFELLHNGTLMELYEQRRGVPLPCVEVQALVHDVTCGVRALHEAGILHRDLKLQNIMLSRERRAKICDFGFAIFLPEHSTVRSPTHVHSPCGTPGYVAPEVLSSSGYGLSADMWSLGIVVYVLLCGKPPFSRVDIPLPSSPLGWHNTTGPNLPKASSHLAPVEKRQARFAVSLCGTAASYSGTASSAISNHVSGLNGSSQEESTQAAGLASSKAVAPSRWMLAQMRRGWEFPLVTPNNEEVPAAAKSFVRELLLEDTSQRLTAKDATKHPWVLQCSSTLPSVPDYPGSEAGAAGGGDGVNASVSEPNLARLCIRPDFDGGGSQALKPDGRHDEHVPLTVSVARELQLDSRPRRPWRRQTPHLPSLVTSRRTSMLPSESESDDDHSSGYDQSSGSSPPLSVHGRNCHTPAPVEQLPQLELPKLLLGGTQSKRRSSESSPTSPKPFRFWIARRRRHSAA